jgi:hypothetical protein
MPHFTTRTPRRRGFSYLETQVAAVLFMLTLSGVVPLFVIQTRQLSRLESRFEPDTVQYLNQPEGSWAKKLGAPAILSDTPPKPYADPTKSAYGVITVDDLDAGYSEQNMSWNDWYHFSWSAAYGSDFTLNFPDGVKDVAVWEFKNLPIGEYDVLVTYPIFAFANEDAEYEFFLNGKDEGHKKVDQRKPLDAPPVNGVLWKKLDDIRVKTSNSTLRVELSDWKATGYNVIDAMRLVPEEPVMFLHEVDAPLGEDFIEVRVHMNYSVD